MINPVRLNAQVTIKERIELDSNTKLKPSPSSALEPYNNFSFFINQSGQVTLDINASDRYYFRDWVLYEESLGRIADGGTISDYNLGGFPQWQKFTFYLYNP